MSKDVIKIEKAQIVYHDFSNKNPWTSGPSFGVRIDGRKAKKMIKDGWNVKTMTVKNKLIWFLPVSINHNFHQGNEIEPKIYMQVLDGKNNIETVDEFRYKFLDFVTIEYSYLVIIGYHWTINKPSKKSGIKAFLKEGYFSVNKNIDANKLWRMM